MTVMQIEDSTTQGRYEDEDRVRMFSKHRSVLAEGVETVSSRESGTPRGFRFRERKNSSPWAEKRQDSTEQYVSALLSEP